MLEAIFVGIVTWAITKQLDKSAGVPALQEWNERPPRASATAYSIADYRGASGAKYRATSYRMDGGGTYTVARRRSNRDWIGFLTDATGQRSFWRADAASQRGMDVLRKDFGV